MMFTDLPRDLESEILARVPATSLSQLRSTCKRWYALFKDPSFVKKNLSKAARQMIFKRNHSVYSVNINLGGINNSFDPSIESTGKLKSLNDSKDDVEIFEIFHCDGLLLCKTLVNTTLVVWNPCTGQTTWIPPSNRNIASFFNSNIAFKSRSYFLGYENNNKSCNSYKILSSTFDQEDPKLRVYEFEIYEFNSDSWRLLEDVTNDSWYILSSGVSLKGNTYWIASDKKDLVNNKFLLRFDFTRERFERLSLPFQSTNLDRNLLLSVVREEKLSLLLERKYMDSLLETKIWVIDTKIAEAKDTTIQYFLVVDYCTHMILYMSYVKSFLLDEENKIVVCIRTNVVTNEERTIVYIVGKDIRGKQVRGEFTNGPLKDYKPLILSYVPSLIHIQQATTSGDKRKRSIRQFIDYLTFL